MKWDMILKQNYQGRTTIPDSPDKNLSSEKYIGEFIKDLRNSIKVSMIPGWEQSGDSPALLDKAVEEMLGDIMEHILQGDAESIYHEYKYRRKKE